MSGKGVGRAHPVEPLFRCYSITVATANRQVPAVLCSREEQLDYRYCVQETQSDVPSLSEPIVDHYLGLAGCFESAEGAGLPSAKEGFLRDE
jgi:hypothetical protein